jgi:Tol biopolymer transport system component
MIGTTLGPYRVDAPLGRGAMGEVYRARDTRLGRDVALKMLPAAVVQDADRRVRFEREARLLAALHHPHIATIFGVEDAGSGQAWVIVMELVEGPTLGEKLEEQKAKGRGLPLRDALAIARQLADALDTAHEKGIVHRDLKPANIKVTPEGVVKVLDFGLAMAGEGSPLGAIDETRVAVSQAGTVVGTAAYMSPEQARGQTVDKRTDIWAFGCVLFEMLTGKRAFDGATASDVTANILHKDPDWTALPAATPPSVNRVLVRCLEKDQKRRQRDIGDVFVELDDKVGAASEANAPASRWSIGRAAWLAAVLLASVGTGLAVWRVKSSPVAAASGPAAVTRFVISVSEPFPLMESRLAMSADGRRIVHVGGRNGVRSLYVHDLDQLSSKLVPGTDGADHPALSPDGAWAAFATDGKIKKIALGGGEPLLVCETPVGLGLTWAANDTIIFNPGNATGLWSVPASGGTAAALTKLQDSELEHRFPDVSPDGSFLLYSVVSVDSSNRNEQLYAQSRRTGERTRLGPGRNPHFVTSGQLVYERDGVILSAPFDPVRLQLTGPGSVAVQGVYQTPLGTGQFAVARTGAMTYVAAIGGRDESVVWVDRSGNEQPTGLSGRNYGHPRLSPDGHLLAVTVVPENPSGPNPSDLWLFDLNRRTLGRMTTDGATMPVWTPDGKRIAFAGSRHAELDIVTRAFDGSGAQELILKGRGGSNFPLSWSPDGRFLVFVNVSPTTGNDLWLLDMNAQHAIRPLVQTQYREGGPTFSPDGQFIAYASDASGRNEIYIRPVSGTGGEVPVSAGGGVEPLWARRAQELFYRQGDATMVVDVTTAPSLKLGQPRRIFDRAYKRSPAVWPNYDVTADGQRFVMIKTTQQAAPAEINVVLNWTPR